MKRPGKMIKQVLNSLFKRPATTSYPFVKAKNSEMPSTYRGKIIFHPEKCIGCKLCMKDCPSGAITITKVGEKFQAEFDLGKCVYCGQCVDSCLKKALETTGDFELAQIDRNKLKVIFSERDKKGPEGAA